MAAVFHRQTEPYSSHDAGDSVYDLGPRVRDRADARVLRD